MIAYVEAHDVSCASAFLFSFGAKCVDNAKIKLYNNSMHASGISRMSRKEKGFRDL